MLYERLKPRKDNAMTEQMKNVDEWNRCHPAGTPVLYHPVMPKGTIDPMESATRGLAWSLADGTGVVRIEGHIGGISLAHLDVLPKTVELAVADLVAVIGHICDTVGRVPAEGPSSEALQQVVTEVHCTCMNAIPSMDPEEPDYTRAREPWLLEEAARLLRAAGKAAPLPHALSVEVREWIDRASVVLELPRRDVR